MARTGGKNSFHVPQVGMVAGICIGDETIEKGHTKDGVEVDIRFNNFISMRPRLDGGSYLKISKEQTDFGRLVKALPRFSNIVGLDVTADGEIITLAALVDLVTAQTGEFLDGLWNASHGAVAAEDL